MVSSLLTRKGSKAENRHLMDNNSASFQLFLIMLCFIAVGSYIQISEVHVTLYSSKVKGILRYL